MRCPFCGHSNIVGTDTCEDCGESLSVFTSAPQYKTQIEETIQSECVGRLASATPVCVSPATPVSAAIGLLAERNIGCVLVTWCDALVGIFSERDALMKVGTRLTEVAQEPVRHFMTPAPDTLKEEDTIAFALNRMSVGDFRHIPIERDERPIGIISVRDVIRYFADEFPEFLPPGR